MKLTVIVCLLAVFLLVTICSVVALPLCNIGCSDDVDCAAGYYCWSSYSCWNDFPEYVGGSVSYCRPCTSISCPPEPVPQMIYSYAAASRSGVNVGNNILFQGGDGTNWGVANNLASYLSFWCPLNTCVNGSVCHAAGSLEPYGGRAHWACTGQTGTYAYYKCDLTHDGDKLDNNAALCCAKDSDGSFRFNGTERVELCGVGGTGDGSDNDCDGTVDEGCVCNNHEFQSTNAGWTSRVDAGLRITCCTATQCADDSSPFCKDYGLLAGNALLCQNKGSGPTFFTCDVTNDGVKWNANNAYCCAKVGGSYVFHAVSTETSCTDESDNDCDGYIDEEDADCTLPALQLRVTYDNGAIWTDISSGNSVLPYPHVKVNFASGGNEVYKRSLYGLRLCKGGCTVSGTCGGAEMGVISSPTDSETFFDRTMVPPPTDNTPNPYQYSLCYGQQSVPFTVTLQTNNCQYYALCEEDSSFGDKTPGTMNPAYCGYGTACPAGYTPPLPKQYLWSNMLFTSGHSCGYDMVCPYGYFEASVGSWNACCPHGTALKNFDETTVGCYRDGISCTGLPSCSGTPLPRDDYGESLDGPNVFPEPKLCGYTDVSQSNCQPALVCRQGYVSVSTTLCCPINTFLNAYGICQTISLCDPCSDHPPNLGDSCVIEGRCSGSLACQPFVGWSCAGTTAYNCDSNCDTIPDSCSSDCEPFCPNGEQCSILGDENVPLNGECDYDSQSCGLGASECCTELHGDVACCVDTTAAVASPATVVTDGAVTVACTATVAGINSVFAYRDVDNNGRYNSGDIDCGWVAGDGWSGLTATFHGCTAGSAVGTNYFRCGIYQGSLTPHDRSYDCVPPKSPPATHDPVDTVTVTATSCSAYSQPSCVGICCWQGQCQGTKTANPVSAANSCVDSPCNYACQAGSCGANCDGSSDPNCDANTCDCTVGYVWNGVQCVVSACTGTPPGNATMCPGDSGVSPVVLISGACSATNPPFCEYQCTGPDYVYNVSGTPHCSHIPDCTASFTGPANGYCESVTPSSFDAVWDVLSGHFNISTDRLLIRVSWNKSQVDYGCPNPEQCAIKDDNLPWDTVQQPVAGLDENTIYWTRVVGLCVNLNGTLSWRNITWSCTTPTAPSFTNLTGFVNDSTGASIPGAAVFVVSPPQGFLNSTAANGHYNLYNVPSGLHSVSASKAGYRSQTREALFEGNALLSLNFTLSNGSCADCADWEGRCSVACSGAPLCGPTVVVPPVCQGKVPGTYVLDDTGSYVYCCDGSRMKTYLSAAPELSGCMDDLVSFTHITRYLGQAAKLTVYTWRPCQD